MEQGIRVNLEALRSVAFGATGPAYVAIGSPFTHQIRLLHIQNLTNADMFFTFDTSMDQILIAAGSFLLLDFTSNKSLVDEVLVVPRGKTLYVRRSGVPTTGSVYLSAFYAY